MCIIDYDGLYLLIMQLQSKMAVPTLSVNCRSKRIWSCVSPRLSHRLVWALPQKELALCVSDRHSGKDFVSPTQCLSLCPVTQSRNLCRYLAFRGAPLAQFWSKASQCIPGRTLSLMLSFGLVCGFERGERLISLLELWSLGERFWQTYYTVGRLGQ